MGCFPIFGNTHMEEWYQYVRFYRFYDVVLYYTYIYIYIINIYIYIYIFLTAIQRVPSSTNHSHGNSAKGFCLPEFLRSKPLRCRHGGDDLMIGKIRDISHTESMGLVYEHLHGFRWFYHNFTSVSTIPIGSMYGILTYIWLIFMVNVGKYTIHGWYGFGGIETHVI